MSGVSSSKHNRDQALEFQGFLNDLQDWEHSLKEDKKLKGQSHEEKKVVQNSQKMGMTGKVQEQTRKTLPVEVNKPSNPVSLKLPSGSSYGQQYDYLKNSDTISHISSSLSTEEDVPSAASEKELGNEYYKQKKYMKAIECYSRSIALSPTAVAFANRGMAYIKIKKFEEAENDCTEALNLDDRYVKAYSRRATARKELGKLKASMEDADFAVRLDPNNQELRKLYTEVKALCDKDSNGKIHSKPPNLMEEIERRNVTTGNRSREQLSDGSSEGATPNSNISDSKTSDGVNRKHNLKASVQELASQAASRAMAAAAKNITTPNTAYQFEVSWRALSDDHVLRARLLKTIPPTTFPQLFKNALSAPILIDIVKCVASFFMEEMELAVSILYNLTKVSRFDMIILCLSAADKADLNKIWDGVFSGGAVPAHHSEMLSKLRLKYCPGGWQMHVLEDNGLMEMS